MARVQSVQSPPQSVTEKVSLPLERAEEVYAPEQAGEEREAQAQEATVPGIAEEEPSLAQEIPVLDIVEEEPLLAQEVPVLKIAEEEPPLAQEVSVLRIAEEEPPLAQPETAQPPEPEAEPPIIVETPAPNLVVPPIPPEQPVQTACPGRPYTVRRGDSFQLIARRFGVSMRALLDANPELQPGRLMVGDVLCIPERGDGAQPSQPAPPDTQPAPAPIPAPVLDSSRHRVAQGESIVDILIARDISLSAFQALNPRLRLGFQRVGDWIRIPPGGARGACGQGTAQRIEVEESIGALAQRLGISIGALLRANPNLLPSDFRVGQVICVPRR